MHERSDLRLNLESLGHTEDSSFPHLPLRRIRWVLSVCLLLSIAGLAYTSIQEHHSRRGATDLMTLANKIGRQRASSEHLVRLIATDDRTTVSATARAYQTPAALRDQMIARQEEVVELFRGKDRDRHYSTYVHERWAAVESAWSELEQRTEGVEGRPPPAQARAIAESRDRLIDAVDRFLLALTAETERLHGIEDRYRTMMLGLVVFMVLIAWLGVVEPGLRLLRRQTDWLESRHERHLRLINRLRSLQQAVDRHCLVTIGDLDGTILDANDQFCRATGYAREELVGHNHRIVNSGVHPRTFWQELYGRVLKGEVWQGEVCNQNRDNSLGWYSTTVCPVTDDEGRIEFIVALRTNITHLRQTEDRLNTATNRLEAILGALPSSVLDLDGEGRILLLHRGEDMHPAMLRDAAAGTMVADAMPCAAAALADAFESLASTGEAAYGRFDFPSPDDLRRCEFRLAKRASDGQESDVRYVLVVTDVTERRRMEEALRAANRRFALAQRSMRLDVWEWSVETDQLRWDGAAGEATANLPDTLTAWIDGHVHPDDRARLTQRFARAAVEGNDLAEEFRWVDPEGAERWVYLTGSPMGTNGPETRWFVGLVADVDERHRLEQAAERLSLVARRTSNAVVITDANGRTEWVNDGFTRITGYSFEEAVGRRPGDLLQGPETGPSAVLAMREAVAHGEPCHVEVVNYHKNGTAYWIEVEIDPLWDAEGHLNGFMAIESDITERVERERLLREEQTRLTLAMANGGLCLWHVDFTDDVLHFTVADHLIGVGGDSPSLIASAVPMSGFWDRVHPDDFDATWEAYHAHVRGETPVYEAVFRWMWVDGQYDWTEARGQVDQFDDQARPLRLIGTSSKVSERFLAAERLAESERRFHAIADSTPAIIWVSDAEGQLTYLNARWREFTGSEEVSIGAYKSFLHPDDLDAAMLVFRSAMANRMPFETAYRLQRADGVWRTMLDRGEPNLAADGTYHGYVGTMIDITEQRQAEEALAHERARLAAFVEHSPAAIAMFDCDMRYLTYSRKWLADYGLEGEHLTGRTHYEVFPAMPERWRLEHQRAMAGEVRRNADDVWTPEGWGHEQNLRWELRPWLDRDGEIGGILMFTEDITELKAIEQSLRASELKFRSLFESAPVGLALQRLETMAFLQVNRNLQETLGYAEDDFRHLPLTRLIHPDSAADFDRLRERLETDGEAEPTEILLQRVDGGVVPTLVGSLVIRDGAGDAVCWSIIQDISERKAWEQAINQQVEATAFYMEAIQQKNAELEQTAEELRRLNEQFEYQAITDPLTRLPNRRGFNQRLSNTLADARRNGGTGIATLFMDLDNFKFINDSLGHEAGDELLKEVAVRAASCVREGGIVGRFAGDEFTVLLEDLHALDDAVAVAERILEAMRPPFTVGGSRLSVRFSIGVAFAADAAEADAEALLRDADAALYAAKARGKGQAAVFEPWMHAEAERRRRLESELRHALDHGELRVDYQPIVDLDDYAVDAVEALVRWNHPTQGLLGPGAFIDVAEEAGLIGEIGQAVLRQAARDLGDWPADAAPRRVFINVSGQEFNDRGFAERLRNLVNEEGLDPSRIVLEITEGTLMADDGRAMERLGELRGIGFGTAMDDFGTGQSSLGRLSAIPVDIVKTDKSLVSELSKDFRTLAVVRAISALCAAVGVKMLAEGVEDEDSLMVAMSVGCRYAQGYHIARPLAAADVPKFVRTWVPPGRAQAS